MARLLLIDRCDSLIPEGLKKNTDWEIRTVSDLEEFRKTLQEETLDLAIINETHSSAEVPALFELGETLAPSLPIVLLTCSSEDESTIHSLQLGALSFVPADASAHELHHVVTRILALSQFSRSQLKILGHCEECHYRFVLGNQQEEIPAIVAYLRDVVGAVMGVGPKEQMRVAVAVEEAMQNAIVHGNLEISSELREAEDNRFYETLNARQNQAPYKDRKVTLEAELNRDSIQLTIRDQGPGFDFTRLPDPTDPEHLLLPHGRGLLLMRAFMDEVVYQPPGNILILRKRYSSTTSTSES